MCGDWDEEVEQINMLVKAFHKTHHPVIYTHTYYEENDPGLEIFTKKVPAMKSLLLNSRGVKLDSRIKAMKKDVHVYSKYVTLYNQTDLLELLRKYKCDTLIICGFSTSAVIRAVATETSQYGIRPIIPAEAVGDRDEYIHRSNLSDIDRKFGDVISVNEVVRYLYRID